MSRYRPSSMPPNGVTRPQWVDSDAVENATPFLPIHVSVFNCDFLIEQIFGSLVGNRGKTVVQLYKTMKSCRSRYGTVANKSLKCCPFNMTHLRELFKYLGWVYIVLLAHWGRDKMAAFSQTTFSNAFSWMKILELQLKFHLSLILWVLLTIFQYWFW